MQSEFVDANQYLARQGDAATDVIFLVSGRARIFTR
jgi:CRP-like cAMP-binding protein